MPLFLLNASTEQVRQAVGAMKRPEGSMNFKCTLAGLHDESMPAGRIVDLAAGAHVFRLVREIASRVTFYYASPGTGTRKTSLDLEPLRPSERIDFWLTWSPEEIRLHAADWDAPSRNVMAVGVPSETRLWVDETGGVAEIGGSGAQVIGARAYSSGRQLLSPPALELWSDTKEAVLVLLSGQSNEGYLHEVVISNAALGMMVTGFETYCETRFVELEREGILPNGEALIAKFGDRMERQALTDDKVPAILQVTNEEGFSLARNLVDRINFQNFEDCKRAYAKGYGIRFGADLGLKGDGIDSLRKLLKYRHRIVHISPLIGLLNQPDVPPEQPELSNRAFAEAALNRFDEFIAALHRATLRLRPADQGTETAN